MDGIQGYIRIVNHCNVTLNNIQKFHYLQASLKGDALERIQSLDFSTSNYHIAWELLCKRYNNDKLLVHKHIRSIYSLPRQLSDTPKGIRNMVNTVLKHLRALNSLAQANEPWDCLIIFLMVIKLHENTATEWEK